jgi:hypothetical protein
MGFAQKPGGLKTCEKCGRVYEMEEFRYPSSDVAHSVDCECGAELIRVPKGTWDCAIKKLVSGPTK